MASPLILRPLVFSDGSARPMVLPLKTEPLQGVNYEFKRKHVNPRVFGPEYIRRPELASYEHSPMEGYSPDGSALEAFLAFVREEWGLS